MNQMPAIVPDMMVQRLLDLWPQTARVFIEHGMACVGCPMAAFETIAEVAAVYEQDPDHFVQALKRCAYNPSEGDGEEAIESDLGDED